MTYQLTTGSHVSAGDALYAFTREADGRSIVELPNGLRGVPADDSPSVLVESVQRVYGGRYLTTAHGVVFVPSNKRVAIVHGAAQ